MNRSPAPCLRRFVIGVVFAVGALGVAALAVGLVSAAGRQERADPEGVASTTTQALAADPVLLGGAPPTTPTTQVDLETAAFDMCQGYVRTRLHSPEAAKFPDLARGDGMVKVTPLRNAQYKVTSSVVSPTKAGVLVRNTFDCVVTKVATGATGWRLDDLTIA